jgi:hypothetical protein
MFSRASQQDMIFLNRGDGTFVESGVQAGKDFQKAAMHRGAAFGGFDRDRRNDAAVSRIGATARVFRTTKPAPHHWLVLRLKGHRGNRDGIGALVRVVSASGAEQWSRVTTCTGYACSSGRIAHFGLGREQPLKPVEIRWPSGIAERRENAAVDRTHTVEEP